MDDGYWRVSREPGSNVVLLVYRGHLKGDRGELASRRFMELAGTDNVHLAANFAELYTYESRVRTDWQKNVWPIRKQILSIACATERSLVKMGVSAFALAMGVRCTFHKSGAELEAAIESLHPQGTTG